jgi:hypothetical protein
LEQRRLTWMNGGAFNVTKSKPKIGSEMRTSAMAQTGGTPVQELSSTGARPSRIAACRLHCVV